MVELASLQAVSYIMGSLESLWQPYTTSAPYETHGRHSSCS